MSDSDLNIGEEASDIFLELSNIGIGRAAATMSELADRQVEISIPELEIFKCGDDISPDIDIDKEDAVAYVCQGFSGDVTGQAYILLNKMAAIRLSSLMFEEEEPGESFGENEQASIVELGNIMIGGLLGTIVNEFDAKIDYEVPEIQLKGFEEFIGLINPKDSVLMIVKAKLSIGAENINCSAILLFTQDACAYLVEKLKNVT